jgi:hypothetical protein
MMLLVAAAASLAASLPLLPAGGGDRAPAAPPPPYLIGFWRGAESCAENCCSVVKGKRFCQGSVPSTLEFGAGGNGTYSIDGLVLASEYRGNFATGHVQSTATAAPHGSFIVEANATNLYGSWISFASQRLFHWDFVRAVKPPPPPPPPPPCANLATSAACANAGCLWKNGGCSSRIMQQVDVFLGGFKAPWGTTYSCFRVPSSVLLPNGDV